MFYSFFFSISFPFRNPFPWNRFNAFWMISYFPGTTEFFWTLQLLIYSLFPPSFIRRFQRLFNAWTLSFWTFICNIGVPIWFYSLPLHISSSQLFIGSLIVLGQCIFLTAVLLPGNNFWTMLSLLRAKIFFILTLMDGMLALFSIFDERNTSVSEMLLQLCLRAGNSISFNNTCSVPTRWFWAIYHLWERLFSNPKVLHRCDLLVSFNVH